MTRTNEFSLGVSPSGLKPCTLLTVVKIYSILDFILYYSTSMPLNVGGHRHIIINDLFSGPVSASETSYEQLVSDIQSFFKLT